MAFEITTRVSCRTAADYDKMVKPIREQHEGSGRNLKWTLMALADFSNGEGFAWPSVKSIENWTGLSTRSVQRALKQAQVLGLVRVRRRTDASSQYLFNLEKLPYVQRPAAPKQRGPHQEYEDWEEPDLFEEHPGTPATVAHHPRQGGTPPVPGTTLPGATVAPYPIIEPSDEPVSEPSGAIAPVDGDPPLPVFIKQEWDKLKTDYPNMGGCRQVTESMVRLVRERAKEHAQTGESLHDVWRVVFQKIRESAFLTGRAKPGKGYSKPYRLTLTRLLKPHIFREVINDGYSGDAAEGDYDPTTGEVLGPAAAATRGTRERFRHARQRAGRSGDPRQDGHPG